MKIKYPRYTREQNLSCKLSEEDIKSISELHQIGVSLRILAILFGVSVPAICYWLLPEEKRKERNRRQYLNSKPIDKRIKYIIQARSDKRKYQIMPEYREYVKQFN